MKKTAFLTILFVLIIFSFSLADASVQSAYIAAATDGPRANSNLTPMAGRAPFYVYFDSAGTYVGTDKNPFLGQPAAGPKVAAYMKNKGIKVMTAGDFGGNLQSFLLTSGIKTFIFHGQADEAVKAIMKSK